MFSATTSSPSSSYVASFLARRATTLPPSPADALSRPLDPRATRCSRDYRSAFSYRQPLIFRTSLRSRGLRIRPRVAQEGRISRQAAERMGLDDGIRVRSITSPSQHTLRSIEARQPLLVGYLRTRPRRKDRRRLRSPWRYPNRASTTRRSRNWLRNVAHEGHLQLDSLPRSVSCLLF
jgi:hypothetical protein